MATKYIRGNTPNDPNTTLVQPGYSHGRGKVTPPALPSWQGPGGMGQVHDRTAVENGDKLLDESLK